MPRKYKTVVRPFAPAQMEAIAHVLGDALTGTEINEILEQCKVENPDPKNTKWRRIYNALVEHQNKEGSGHHVVGFITKAMQPVKWVQNKERYEQFCDSLNNALAFAGFRLEENGEVKFIQAASTISDAHERAGRLRTLLEDRGVHTNVLLFCRAEWLQDNHFHAVLEAVKSVGDRLRKMSGIDLDGAKLVDAVLSLGKSGQPVIAISPLSSETEKGEQRAFASFVKGIFGMFRNPTAHEPKFYWPIDEQDALEILGAVSLTHRKLDKAKTH